MVTFYWVFEDYSYDVTLELRDVAIFRCQMSLDRNHLSCVCLQLGTRSCEGLCGYGSRSCQPSLSRQMGFCSDPPRALTLCSGWTHMCLRTSSQKSKTQRVRCKGKLLCWEVTVRCLFLSFLKFKSQLVSSSLLMDGWKAWVDGVIFDVMIKEFKQ
jgi:hypothetical protein